MKHFYSHGKLLLTSEYLVLDGALALAIPTKFGQHLTVKEIDEPYIIWESLDNNGWVWFSSEFSIKNNQVALTSESNEFSERLLQILTAVEKLNPNFLRNHGFKVSTSLDFPRDWGLGTSSTLINNIAQWASINAYQLLELTFGGSGYDIACAQHTSPITYQLNNPRHVTPVTFNPPFKEQLYFVYLNKKQNSRESISTYRKKSITPSDIEKATDLTQRIIACQEFGIFCRLMDEHEDFIGHILKVKPVKERLFPDFSGSIKSLGGWGGDFILVASKDHPKAYFKSKGFETIIPYAEMTLN